MGKPESLAAVSVPASSSSPDVATRSADPVLRSDKADEIDAPASSDSSEIVSDSRPAPSPALNDIGEEWDEEGLIEGQGEELPSYVLASLPELEAGRTYETCVFNRAWIEMAGDREFAEAVAEGRSG
ncbi:hypothetical protein IAR55_005892 [Kwoniella newhampshirensis]|uniref:Uncharacterized protein n=1 Tax=Kwoniella newhampshirensis TaxID=1651941 RepID=A0AAW0YHJ7_9TREE